MRARSVGRGAKIVIVVGGSRAGESLRRAGVGD